MRIFFGLFIFIASHVQAQNQDTLGIDTIKKVSPLFSGGIYVDLGLQQAPNPCERNFSGYVGLGVQYEKWSLGVSMYDFVGSIESFTIFPNTFRLDYRYAGPYLMLQVYDTKYVSAAIRASYQWGDMVWQEQGVGSSFLRDEFNMMNFVAIVNLNRFRYAKPYLFCGYQQLRQLNLSQLDAKDFSGIFFGIGIRIGYFN